MHVIEPWQNEERRLHEKNIAVSSALLARLLKFHGDNPPDEEASMAARRHKERVARYARMRSWIPVRRVPHDPLPLAETHEACLEYFENPLPAVKGTAEYSLHEILREVARKHKCSVREMKSTRRNHYLVYARHEYAWRAQRETMCSLTQIAGVLGQDHTSIVNGIKRHQERIDAGTAK